MATLLSYALCTVADVKELLGIDAGDSSKNNLIIRKINQATEMIEGYTQRRLASTVYTNEEYDATGTNQLVLRQRPVTALSSLSARDTSLNSADWDVIDTEHYFYDSGAGIINGISTFYGGYNRWRVTYTAGYTTIPADLAEACATLAAYLVENPVGSGATSGVKSKREGARQVEYHAPSQQSTESLITQLGIDDILDRYADTVIA